MKSLNGNFTLVPANTLLDRESFSGRSDADFLDTTLRDGSCKEAPFVLLGIAEAIGPIANYGRSGAQHAFEAFLSFFRRLPNQPLPLTFLGCIEYLGSENLSPLEASERVLELDEFVYAVLTQNLSNQQIPLVIGGGHNNALPLLRWAKATYGVGKAVNIDAHSDCRPIQYRHSGNSFSTAIDEGALEQYTVLGLHRYSLSSSMENYMKGQSIHYTFYEDYLLDHRSLNVDFQQAIEGERIGLEIDVDSIANMPSSAKSPSGWRLDDLRGLLLGVKPFNVAYLHLTEAAPTNSEEERIVGKALSYLCLDFLYTTE
jgi:formiminoglutamase